MISDPNILQPAHAEGQDNGRGESGESGEQPRVVQLSSQSPHKALGRSSERVASPAVLTFAIPDAHAEFFAKRVAHDEQKRVRRVLAALEKIAAAGKVNPKIRVLAPALQMTFCTLRRQYYDYMLGCEKADQIFEPGDWRSILNWTKVRSEKANLPFGFLEFWRTLGEQNQRKWKPAWDELMHIIRTHQGFPHGTAGAKFYKSLPGFAEWPAIDPVLGHPPGMSYENLMRHVSDPFDTSLARHGRAKASELRLPVLKTRVGRAFGSVLIFDDHDFNQKVLFQKKIMRPMGFGCVEYLSGACLKLGVKPTLWDEEEQKKRVLTEREFLWFFLAVLCGVGYNPNGCRFDLENAKATIREPWLARFKAILGDKFEFNFGSRPANFTRAPHAGQFAGKPKGNFRTKALIESFWNPVDNQTAMLAGQMGKDRDHAPAQLYGAQKYAENLIRQAEKNNVPLESLQFPVDLYSDWCRYAHEAIWRINTANDHAMEGWEKCGFVRSQWRENESSAVWLERADFDQLPETTRAILARRLEANPALVRKTVLSRWDVVQQSRHLLKRFPMHHIPEILGAEFALNGGEPLAVRNGMFSFDCAEIDSDTLHFYARDERGFFKTGEKFIAFVNPYLATHLVACDARLRVVGLCERIERAHDDASLQKLLGAQNEQMAAATARLNLRHDDESRQIRRMKEHNRALLGGEAAPAQVTIGTGEAPASCEKELLERAEALANETPDDWA